MKVGELMNKYILMVLVAVSTFMGCTQLVEVKLEPEVTVYLSENTDKKIRLTESDAEHTLLKTWLAEHKDGWLTTSGKYSGGVYLTSGEYGIQITDSKVVLYTDITEIPTAIYAQEIERSELRALKDLAKK